MERIPDVVMVGMAVGVFVGGTVWGLAWWLSGQFIGIRNLVHELIDKTEHTLISKLEYHEKHDDSRFEDLKRDIWEIKLRAASNMKFLKEEIEKN